MSKVTQKLSYKDAGVDVESGDHLVEWLQKQQASVAQSAEASPWAEQIASGIGGFAAVFRFPSLIQNMTKPALVAATDGVGTKVKLAVEMQKFDTIGQDLVAMCVNDLICCGGQPLFFLDYYATGKLDLPKAQGFLAGVRAACIESGCALIGGETAEMPGVYQGSDFDCAGFAVGVVDEDNMLGAHRVQIGSSCLIGVSSSGFHSNGYSLLRRLFSTPEDLGTWGERLLTPTHLYPRLAARLMSKNLVQAMAHITGGGMENIPRVLPVGSCVHLFDWPWPEEFIEVQDRSGLSRVEMLQTLNCGIGLVLLVAPEKASEVRQIITEMNFKAFDLGIVQAASDSQAAAEIVYG